ncbi:hypothetical protein PAXINDRAFT_95613 [Paxillus involutus ATCC 200175]|nr:hypothetical protein PAXINDRAFT_95613 [Paxillus involutus ATCC 200175]
MDEDVDMDAPQISTLREEDTPPPSRTSKFRVNLLVGDKKGKGKSSSPSGSAAARKNIPPTQPQSRPQSDEEEEEEEEEDQLIDDDEPAPSISAPVATAGTKRKAPSKKARPRKGDKREKDDKKLDVEPQEPPQSEEGQSVSAVPPPEKPSPKKKAAPRKAPAASKPKTKVPAKGAKALAIPPVDDTAMSETHTVTAPSSPFPAEAHSGGGSPEPEETEAPPPPAPEGPGDSAPLPVYPLPSKPFPVQPPPKIGTGFAPMQPLDRSGAKLRQWRVANREIRGIAGGRWFARSWVGDKESEFATAVAAASAAAAAKLADGDKIATPKSITSISAPILGKAGKSKAARASAGVSTAPSRSGSIVPELHPPKAPTKMRNIIARPASEDGDEPEAVAPEAPGLSMDS